MSIFCEGTPIASVNEEHVRQIFGEHGDIAIQIIKNYGPLDYIKVIEDKETGEVQFSFRPYKPKPFCFEARFDKETGEMMKFEDFTELT